MWNDKYTEELNKLFDDWHKEADEVDKKYKKLHDEISDRFHKEKTERRLRGLN